jgi:hypothetical protein
MNTERKIIKDTSPKMGTRGFWEKGFWAEGPKKRQKEHTFGKTGKALKRNAMLAKLMMNVINC